MEERIAPLLAHEVRHLDGICHSADHSVGTADLCDEKIYRTGSNCRWFQDEVKSERISRRIERS